MCPGLQAVPIKRIESANEVMLREFVARLLPLDVTLRFASPHRLGTPKALTGAFHVPGQRMTWAVGPDRSLVGILNCALVRPSVVELGLIVRSDLKRQGIGSWLLDHTIAEARQHGIRTLSGFVLDGNRAMRTLALKCGFRTVGQDGFLSLMELQLFSDTV